MDQHKSLVIICAEKIADEHWNTIDYKHLNTVPDELNICVTAELLNC